MEVRRTKSIIMEVRRTKSIIKEVRRTKSIIMEVRRTKSIIMEVRRTKSIIMEVPTGSLPVWMNPSYPLCDRNARFFGIPADVLNDVPKMFFIANDAVVALFFQKRSFLLEALIYMR
jgi:hypothetical protein